MAFGPKVRLGMYEKIASYLGTGVDLDNAMEEMAEAYNHFKKGDIRAKILRELRACLASGMTLANALTMWAPPAEVMLIKAGEKSGDLEGAMENAKLATNATKEMKSAIISQLSYPLVLVIMLLVMMYIFSIQAVPQLAEVMPPSQWPAISMGLYYISMAVKNYWLEALIVFAVVFIFVAKTLPSLSGSLRKKLDIFPPYSIYKSYQGSIFLVSLSALMTTGVAVYEALNELKDLSPKYVKDHINKMQGKLMDGNNIGGALETGLLDRETAIDMRVYGSKPNIEDKMGTIGKNAIDYGIKRIESIGSLIRGLMTMAIGGYIAYVLIAFSVLTQSMKQM
ncbi:type II secretion system F family protein [Pseudomonas luteola]